MGLLKYTIITNLYLAAADSPPWEWEFLSHSFDMDIYHVSKQTYNNQHT